MNTDTVDKSAVFCRFQSNRFICIHIACVASCHLLGWPSSSEWAEAHWPAQPFWLAAICEALCERGNRQQPPLTAGLMLHFLCKLSAPGELAAADTAGQREEQQFVWPWRFLGALHHTTISLKIATGAMRGGGGGGGPLQLDWLLLV